MLAMRVHPALPVVEECPLTGVRRKFLPHSIMDVILVRMARRDKDAQARGEDEDDDSGERTNAIPALHPAPAPD